MHEFTVEAMASGYHVAILNCVGGNMSEVLLWKWAYTRQPKILYPWEGIRIIKGPSYTFVSYYNNSLTFSIVEWIAEIGIATWFD